MNRLARSLATAAAVLSGRPFALIGGIAVSARSEPRFTRDLDLAVAVPDDPSAEVTVRTMLGHGFRTAALIEQDAVERLATVRLIAPDEHGSGVVVDLLFASSGIEPEIVAAAESLEAFAGVVVPVARTGHLIALKVLSRNDATRPQDAVDLQALLRIASEDDIELARQSAQLISERGFHRERDLAAALEAAIQTYRRPAE